MNKEIKNFENITYSLEELKKTYKITVIVGASIIASLLIYALIVELIRSEFKPFPGFVTIPEIQVLKYIFYGFVFFEVIAINILRPMLLKERPTDDLNVFILKLNRAAIITYVFCEVPAILGLVLFLLSGLHTDFYIFLFLSLILEILYFPKFKNWEEAIRNKIMSPKL
jgi:hypothetical protein